MKAIFCVLFMICTNIASGQIIMKMDSLFEIQGELYKIIEYEANLPIEVRDSFKKKLFNSESGDYKTGS